MKKIFTLIAVAVMAISANAEVIYSWSSTGPDAADVTEVGGKATAKVDEARVNYANSINGVTYYTICLCGKAQTYPESAYVNIALDKPLAADDEISVTAYRNKNATGKAASIDFMFMNGETKVAELDSTEPFANIHPEGDNPGEEPSTQKFTVPADAAGCTVIDLSRGAGAATNLFITKFEITRGGETAGIVNVNAAEENAPVYNLQGVQVDDNYKGIVIKNGKKYINK